MSPLNGRFLVAMAAALTLVLTARGAGAQDFSLQLRDGLVTLVARDAAVPQILDRWAQLGGTTIVNRENIKSAAVTLELNEVPERAALAILLRGVGGYILAERNDGQGGSVIDRILILRASTVPVRSPSPPAIVSTEDAVTASEPTIFREPDIQEPEPLGSPTGRGVIGSRIPERGSTTLGFNPPAPPQSNPGTVGNPTDQGAGRVDNPGASLVPRANPFGATTASLRPGEVTSQAEPAPLPSPSVAREAESPQP